MKIRNFFNGFILAALLSTSLQVHAYEALGDETPTGEAMAFDLFIARPLGLVGTVAGTAIYIVALPFNLLTFNLAAPARKLILEPIDYTFVRPLGADH